MKLLLYLVVLISPIALFGQNYKFGKVSVKELQETVNPIDKSAPAAILYAERKTKFEYTESDGFYLVTEYYKRIKIYTKEGFDYASLQQYLYYDVASRKEEMLFVKGVTYNLDKGKIIKSKLKNSAIFEERLNRYYFTKKFTMPNLKNGSVIEWKYTIKSPFWTRLSEVKLQYSIPVKKIKTTLYIPEYFHYNSYPKGYLHIPIENSVKNREIFFQVHLNHENTLLKTTKTQSTSAEFQENIYTITMTDVPALSDEAYSGNIDNYKAGIIYELAYVNIPGSTIHSYAKDWKAVVSNINNSDAFGNQLKQSKHFSDDLAKLNMGKNAVEKTLAIYNFIKQKIKWNGIQGYYTDKGVKKSFKEGVGNTADINLNLVSMLRASNLEAHPVLISTISNGIPVFPTRAGFNYVIAYVKIGEDEFLLDATDPLSLPNILPKKTLNFRGRVIYPTGLSKWIDLFPKKHSIKKTNINVVFDGTRMQGNARTNYTKRYALSYRKETLNKSTEELLDWIDENLEEIDVLNARVANRESSNKAVIETIKFQSDTFNEDINNQVFITPYLYLQGIENPFKTEKRDFPVYFNTPWVKVANINIAIPENFTVVSLPEDAEFGLLNDLGYYKTTYIQQGKTIKIAGTFAINKPVISAENYQELKEFYQKVITEQAKKIILKKL